MPPRVFQGGSGGATPPQVSFIASCGPLLVQIWRTRGEGKGHEERWLKLVGGGTPCNGPGGTFWGLSGEGKGGEIPHYLTPF